MRVVTPSASTFSRVAGSPKRAMPHTSLSADERPGEPERDAPGRTGDQDLLVLQHPQLPSWIFDPNVGTLRNP